MKLQGTINRVSRNLHANVSPRAGGGRVKDVIYEGTGDSLVNGDGNAIIPTYPVIPPIPVKDVKYNNQSVVDEQGNAIIPPYPSIPTSNKNLYGTSIPTSVLGNDGDLYFLKNIRTIKTVDYIETTGGQKTQFIPTGIKMDGNTIIEIDCEISSNVYGNYQGILGWRNSTPYYGLYTRFAGGNVFAGEWGNMSSAIPATDAGLYDTRVLVTVSLNVV